MENGKTPRRDLLNELGLENFKVFKYPDYDSAIIGYDANDSRIVYDYESMAEHLMNVDGMTYEEAIEFIEYNTLRFIPYVGSNAPIIMQSIKDYLPYHEATKKYEYNFDVKYHLERCIAWTRAWFDINLPGHKAILGMSAGKDSTIAAAILARALGPENVIGVAMPDEGQTDNGAEEICNYLGIKYMYMPINNITKGFEYVCPDNEDFKWSKQAETNIPPRIRMTMLYAIAQTFNGVVINTCNFSEEYTGYLSIFGDGAGGMSPIAKLTCTEVIALGDELGLPYEWVHKIPDDGLPNSSTDEEKMGFSYEVLDNWIREGERVDDETMNKILTMNRNSQFKRDILNIPAYDPNLKVY